MNEEQEVCLATTNVFDFEGNLRLQLRTPLDQFGTRAGKWQSEPRQVANSHTI